MTHVPSMHPHDDQTPESHPHGSEPRGSHPHETHPRGDRQQAAEDIFEQVRALDPDAREAAIDAGSDDAWVRAEVRSLLEFDISTLATLGSRRDARFDAAACVGLSVGGFTLREVIGVGGMGTVFAADQELPARAIAVKVLHSAAARPSTLARFRKESEFLARLDHPNIARVIAAGALQVPGDGGARPYFAMELVAGGRSITRWARETRASRADAVRALATACDAVGSGHRSGIAHLDLKPGNILVSSAGVVKVIDYGIARSIAADGPTEQDAAIVGTPQYMSPEQFVRGAGAAVDSRADVHALGLILYELLTDRLPYDTRGMSLAAAARMVREAAPVAPRRIDSTIPRDLDAIARKALARDRDARYGSASELADDLRRWLDDEPVVAAPPRGADAFMRLVRRNPLPASLAAAAVASLALGAAVSLRSAVREADAAARLRVEAARARMQAAAADAARGETAESVPQLERVPADLRGWEWRHVHAQIANATIYSVVGAEVLSVASLDASNEAVAGVTGGFIEIADCAGVRTPELHDLRSAFAQPQYASIAAVSASPDCREILATTNEGDVLAIDRGDSSIRHLVRGGGVRAAALADVDAGKSTDAPSLRLVAIADPAGGAFIVDASSGATIARLAGVGAANDACFTRDGRQLLVALADGALRMIDLDPSAPAERAIRERWRTAPRPSASRAAAVSDDGNLIGVAWRDGRITVHAPADGAILSEADLPGGSVFDLAASPDHSVFAASSWSNQVRVIDARTLAITRRLSGSGTHVWGIAFSADGTRLLGRIGPTSTSAKGDLIAIDCLGAWSMGDAPATIRQCSAGTLLQAATAGPRPGLFTAVSADGALLEIDARAGVVRTLAAAGAAANADSIARAGDAAVVGHSDGAVSLFRVDDAAGTARSVWRTRALPGRIGAIGVTPDGGMIAVGNNDHSVGVLDAADGGVRWTAEIPLPKHAPNRRGVRRPIFLDGGRAVTFAAILAGAERIAYRTSDGAPLPERRGGDAYEWEDGFERRADGRIYMLGITGFLNSFRDGEAPEFSEMALNGGVMCTDAGETRLFVAARDGLVRAAGFDPVTPLLRLEAPPGIPLAIAFDDEADELTVVSARGIARTWLGRGAQQRTVPPRPSLPQSLRDGALPAEPEPGAK